MPTLEQWTALVENAVRIAAEELSRNNRSKRMADSYKQHFVSAWSTVDVDREGSLTPQQLDEVALLLANFGWSDWRKVSKDERICWSRLAAVDPRGRVAVEDFARCSESPSAVREILQRPCQTNYDNLRRLEEALNVAEEHFKRNSRYSAFGEKYRPMFHTTWCLFDPGCAKACITARDARLFAQIMESGGWRDWDVSDREKQLWDELQRRQGSISVLQFCEISENPHYQLPSPELAAVAQLRDEPSTAEPEPAIDESSACVVCLTNRKCVLFVPCRHVALCEQCVNDPSFKQPGKPLQCPVCRERVEQHMKIFI